MKTKNKLLLANIALMFAVLFLVALTTAFAFLYEKEAYNRQFEKKLYNGILDIKEGRTGAKEGLLTEIEKADTERLDTEATDLLGFLFDNIENLK